MYSRKDISPNYTIYIEFSKNQTRIGRFAWSQNPTRGKFVLNPFSSIQEKWVGTNRKKTAIIFDEKEREAILAIRNTVIHNVENLGLIPILELTSDKESTMDQELPNCKNMYDIAAYHGRQVCVTIKK